MGEYATRKSDRAEIKIGTCNVMYYLRWEDRMKVIPQAGSINPATTPNLLFRLPLPSEDSVKPGEYEPFDGIYPLGPDSTGKPFAGDPDYEPGTIQLRHPSGLLLNVQCHHMEQLPDVGPKASAFWNNKMPDPWLLAFIKSTPDGLVPIVKCEHCGMNFRSDWPTVLPHVADKQLHDRLAEMALFPVAA